MHFLNNKNTRTLGAGDYPALKVFFILKVHEKVNLLAFTIDWIDVCSQTRGSTLESRNLNSEFWPDVACTYSTCIDILLFMKLNEETRRASSFFNIVLIDCDITRRTCDFD